MSETVSVRGSKGLVEKYHVMTHQGTLDLLEILTRVGGKSYILFNKYHLVVREKYWLEVCDQYVPEISC